MGITKSQRAAILLRLCFVSIAMCLCVLYTRPLQAQINTNQVIYALRHPQPNLYMVAAHRGVWGKNHNDIPENSLASIQQAANDGVEMIELDIKLSSDGVPVLMHDFTDDRTTSTAYNPRYEEPGEERVDSVSASQLQGYSLVKPDRSGYSNQHVPTLAEALQYIKDHQIAIVVLLDIKDRKAMQAAENVVLQYSNHWGNPAQYWVVYKFNATTYPDPATLEGDVNKPIRGSNGNTYNYYPVLVIPVFTTNMTSKINCFDTYKAYKGKLYTVAIEDNLKQDYGLNSDIYNDASVNGLTLGIFNALPDGGGICTETSPSDNTFTKNTGECFYRLSDLYHCNNGQCDTADNRGSWSFLDSLDFRLITTDDADGLISHLQREGRRDTGFLYQKN